MALRILTLTAVTLAIMVVVLVVGRLAGGIIWLASIAFCTLAYVVLVARATLFRQRLARWTSRRRHD